ncbi:MAG: hypothetical protein AB7K09_18225 [Planctomycetota bacterium]
MLRAFYLLLMLCLATPACSPPDGPGLPKAAPAPSAAPAPDPPDPAAIPFVLVGLADSGCCDVVLDSAAGSLPSSRSAVARRGTHSPVTPAEPDPAEPAPEAIASSLLAGLIQPSSIDARWRVADRGQKWTGDNASPVAIAVGIVMRLASSSSVDAQDVLTCFVSGGEDCVLRGTMAHSSSEALADGDTSLDLGFRTQLEPVDLEWCLAGSIALWEHFEHGLVGSRWCAEWYVVRVVLPEVVRRYPEEAIRRYANRLDPIIDPCKPISPESGNPNLTVDVAPSVLEFLPACPATQRLLFEWWCDSRQEAALCTLLTSINRARYSNAELDRRLATDVFNSIWHDPPLRARWMEQFCAVAGDQLVALLIPIAGESSIDQVDALKCLGVTGFKSAPEVFWTVLEDPASGDTVWRAARDVLERAQHGCMCRADFVLRLTQIRDRVSGARSAAIEKLITDINERVRR